MIDYFDFSENANKVFIPKARHSEKKCVFDKFYESQIKDAPSLDKYAEWCKNQSESKDDNK